MSHKKKTRKKQTPSPGKRKSTKTRVSLNGFSHDVGNELRKAIQCHQSGQLGKAEEIYRRILQIHPNHTVSLHLLGVIANQVGNNDLAIKLISKAIKNDPENAAYYNSLGNAFQDQGKLDEAISCYKKALELKPDYAEAHSNLGLVLYNLRKYEEAMACYTQAIRLKPDHALAMGNLACLYEQINRLDDAREAAVKALRLDPHLPAAHLVAAKCQRREGKCKEALSQLENTDLKSSSSLIQAAILHEKGRLYDRLGSYNKAFECFSHGNALISQTWMGRQIDRNSSIHEISVLTSFFSDPERKFWNSSVEFPKAPDPVFLVGFPRSGTTLLEQILGTHPNIETLEERPLVHAMIQRLKRQGLRYPDDLAEMDFGLIEDLRNTYLLKVSEYLDHPYDGIFVDKFPLGMIHIGLINRVFPKSRIILALRHPYDVCLSCFMQSFALNESMAQFLKLNDTAGYYDLVMALWAIYVDRLTLNFHVIKYEDLITDFNKETKRLLDFLQMQWHPSVRDYASHAKSKRNIATPSYDQVSEPIYARSMYRWRHYVTHLKPILAILKPHVERFGYDLTTDM